MEYDKHVTFDQVRDADGCTDDRWNAFSIFFGRRRNETSPIALLEILDLLGLDFAEWVVRCVIPDKRPFWIMQGMIILDMVDRKKGIHADLQAWAVDIAKVLCRGDFPRQLIQPYPLWFASFTLGDHGRVFRAVQYSDWRGAYDGREAIAAFRLRRSEMLRLIFA